MKTKMLYLTLLIFLIANISYTKILAANETPESLFKFTHVQLQNGIQFYYRHMDRAPLTGMYILFDGGFKNEPQEHKGMAHLLEHIFFRGTDKYSAQSIYQVENSGGYFNGFTSLERTEYMMQVPEKDVEKAASMLMDMVFNPAIRVPDMEMEKKIVLSEDHEREASQSTSYSFNLFYDFLFRTDEAGIISLTRDDLVKFHDQIYQPENAVVVIAGKFSDEKIKGILESWPNKSISPVSTSTTPELKDKSGQSFYKEMSLPQQSYQLLMSYNLGPLSGDDLLVAKLIPALIDFEGLKLDYLHDYADLNYYIDLASVGKNYYLFIYFDSADEPYTDDVGTKYKDGMLKIIKRLTKKDFSIEKKRIIDILSGFKEYSENSATDAAAFFIGELNATTLTLSDISGLSRITMDNIHNFAQTKLLDKPYAWIVVKNKAAKGGDKK